jgi:hypothetical protein
MPWASLPAAVRRHLCLYQRPQPQWQFTNSVSLSETLRILLNNAKYSPRPCIISFFLALKGDFGLWFLKGHRKAGSFPVV